MQLTYNSPYVCRKLHYETVADADGRKRRRVVFGDAEDGQEDDGDDGEDAESGEEDAESGEEDEEGDEDEENEDSGEEDGDVEMEEDAPEESRLSLPARLSRLAAGADQEDSEEEEDSHSEDSDGEEDSKLTPTAPVLRQNARQLHRLIYGTGE